MATRWEFDCRRLGDEFGTWLLIDPGISVSRPGVSWVTAVPSVRLVSDTLPATPVFNVVEDAAEADVEFPQGRSHVPGNGIGVYLPIYEPSRRGTARAQV